MQGVNEEVLGKVAGWLQNGASVWFATIVETWGASPRPAGSLFAFCPAKGAIAGSLSGGCIEDDLLAELATKPCIDKPEERVYGESAEDQQRLQLPCGGRLAIMLEFLDGPASLQHFSELAVALQSRRRVIRSLCLQTGDAQLKPRPEHLRVAVKRSPERLDLLLGAGERLLIIGSGEVSAYLHDLAGSLDFAVTICEPREEHFERWSRRLDHCDVRQRLPDDLILEEFNDPYCAIVALAHDPRVDDMGLLAALRSAAFYVGAMGSARTSKNRIERLRSLGLGESELSRLHAPIGLPVGSKTPPEIAVAIAAQLIKARATMNAAPASTAAPTRSISGASTALS